MRFFSNRLFLVRLHTFRGETHFWGTPLEENASKLHTFRLNATTLAGEHPLHQRRHRRSHYFCQPNENKKKERKKSGTLFASQFRARTSSSPGKEALCPGRMGWGSLRGSSASHLATAEGAGCDECDLQEVPSTWPVLFHFFPLGTRKHGNASVGWWKTSSTLSNVFHFVNGCSGHEGPFCGQSRSRGVGFVREKRLKVCNWIQVLGIM